MFSPQDKAVIAAHIEKMLITLHHPEMPSSRPHFHLHVDGKESWSWADIDPNWAVEAAHLADLPFTRVTRFGDRFDHSGCSTPRHVILKALQDLNEVCTAFEERAKTAERELADARAEIARMLGSHA